MLFRKIAATIENHLKNEPDRILLLDGARQVGKTFIVRHVAQKLFKNYVEIDLYRDAVTDRIFDNVRNLDSFYLMISSIAGGKVGTKADTIVFLDEIQQYPHLLTLLKFLQQDGRYTYVASGSLLGVTLASTTSIPMGSIRKIRMYPLDLEEFMIANGVGEYAIESMRKSFDSLQPLDENLHNYFMDLFKKYLLCGGLPAAVNEYLETKNIGTIREYHTEIQGYYVTDATSYDKEHKLKIGRIYDMIPSNLENKKKRLMINRIEPDKKSAKRASGYLDEFNYLISSGIALEVKAVSNPTYPLHQTMTKNLLKLYMNDVGLLTNIFYGTKIESVMLDRKSINLGSVYECVTACELAAHGFELFYYDNRDKGEVDFLIDDQENECALPIEIKSGKDYSVHSSLNSFLSNKDYNISRGFVFSNERNVSTKDKVTYLPIYYIMFLKK